jgi:hypothetical protein
MLGRRAVTSALGTPASTAGELSFSSMALLILRNARPGCGMAVKPTVLLRQTLKLRSSRFQEDQVRAILSPIELRWAANPGNVGRSISPFLVCLFRLKIAGMAA